MYLYAFHTSTKFEVDMTLHLEVTTSFGLSLVLFCDLI